MQFQQQTELADSNNAATCTGGTVREIADYFEHMSKNSAKTDKMDKNKPGHGKFKYQPFPKRVIKKTDLSSFVTKNEFPVKSFGARNLLSSDISLHTIWKENVLKNGLTTDFEENTTTIANKFRDSFKCSVNTCALILQYIL